jgi:hypothetical protein
MTDTWVFPVGHYLGPHHPAAGAAPDSHRVRVGDEVVRLASEAELLGWGLAHGVPAASSEPGRVWTRSDVTRLAGERTSADLSPVLADLLAAGALVEVGPDGVAPAIFARSHRLQPLLSGLGSGAGRPDRYRIGLFGEEPVAVVDVRVFDLWQWATRVGTLADLTGMQALTGPLLGDEDDGVPGLLHRVHRLLANGCGYLDVAAPRVAPDDGPARAGQGVRST